MTRGRYKRLWRAFLTDVIIINKHLDEPPADFKTIYRNLETIHPLEGDSYAESWEKIRPTAEGFYKQAQKYKQEVQDGTLDYK